MHHEKRILLKLKECFNKSLIISLSLLFLIWRVVPNGWFLSVIDEPEVWSGSTNARADQGYNSHGEDIGNTNGDSHEAPLMAPTLPPPPLMTHVEMMAEMLAARLESVRVLEMIA